MSARSSRSIFRNSVYLAISLATKVLVYALLARALGREDVGVLLYSIALLELALGLSSFGVPQLAVREISSGQAEVRRFFSNLLCLRLTLAAVALGVIALLVWRGVLQTSSTSGAIILVVSVAVLPKTLSDCLDVFFAVREQFIVPASLDALNHVLFAGGCLLLLLFRFDLLTVAVFYLAVAIFVAALRVGILRTTSYFGLSELSLAACWRLLEQLVPFGVLGLTMVFYLRVGDVAIVWLVADGVEQLALFKMAHLPVAILVGLLAASVMPFYGNITKLGSATDRAGAVAFADTLRSTARYVLIIGGLLVLAPTVLAEPLLVLMCGSKWAASAPLLKLMLWHAPLPALVAIFGRSLQAVGKERRVAVAGVVLLLGKGLLLLLLIPRHGALGLALATVGGAVLSFGLLSALTWPLLRPARQLGPMVATLVAFGAAALVAYRGIFAEPVLDALASYGVFAVLLVLTGAVGRDDLGALRKSLARR